MKFTIDRSVLLKTLSHVQSVVERRGTIPILSNVKLEAGEDTLTLTGTDMDLSLLETTTATVQSAGAVTVPAHTFYDIVRKLPEGSQVEISGDTKGGRVSIKAGSSRFSLSSLPVGDFPVMAEGELTHSFKITAAECRALIEKARFAVSTEETRYYLNGIYLHASGTADAPTLRAVATDGHRLARIEIALPAGATGMPGVIIPRKTVGELKKLLEEGAEEVSISLSDTKIRFVSGQAVLVSKLIDGTFPDYERVIPSGNDKPFEVDCKSFSAGVDRVSVISSEKSRGIKLSIEKGRLTLSAGNSDAGNASEEIDANYAADPIEIGFNSRYLLEMMQQVEGDRVQFVLADASSPALVRDTGDVSSLYVIMPMRV